jgi:aryl-alcohol dehydrogenase-like predicted oxidoreductase
MADSSEKELKAIYRQLGKSGLRVSVPILGCMSFGDPDWAGVRRGPYRGRTLELILY